MPSGTSPTWPLRESNLLHQAHEVIEEPLLRDLPLLIPCGHRTELHAETLPGRRDDLPIPGLHRSLHRAGEFRDGARVVSFRKEDLVRAVDEVVVREGLEEFSGFHVMVVPSPRGWGPAGPVHGDILSVTLPKSLPKRTSRSGIPSIVIKSISSFCFIADPCLRIVEFCQEILPFRATGSRTPRPPMNCLCSRPERGTVRIVGQDSTTIRGELGRHPVLAARPHL